mgnify:CR=1 FL=1
MTAITPSTTPIPSSPAVDLQKATPVMAPVSGDSDGDNDGSGSPSAAHGPAVITDLSSIAKTVVAAK